MTQTHTEQKHCRAQTHPPFRHSAHLVDFLETAPEKYSHIPLPGADRIIPQETCPGVQGTPTQPSVKSCLSLEHTPTKGSPDFRSVGHSSCGSAQPGLQAALPTFPVPSRHTGRHTAPHIGALGDTQDLELTALDQIRHQESWVCSGLCPYQDPSPDCHSPDCPRSCPGDSGSPLLCPRALGGCWSL